MMQQDIQIDRNGAVALGVLLMITALCFLIPYATLTAHVIGSFPNPPVPSVPVYIVSVLAQESEYWGYAVIVSAVHSNSMVFISLTQVIAILHVSVGSGRLRRTTALFIMLVVSSIWAWMCSLAYGYLPSWTLLQLPFIPFVGTISMFFYTEKMENEGPGASAEWAWPPIGLCADDT